MKAQETSSTEDNPNDERFTKMPPRIQVRKPLPGHYPRIVDWLARNGHEHRAFHLHRLWSRPQAAEERSSCLVAVWERELIGFLRYNKRKLSYGSASVNTAIMTDCIVVDNHPQIIHFLISHLMTDLAEQGAHLVLWRKPVYLTPWWGFDALWQDHYLQFKSPHIENAAVVYNTRIATETDIPGLMALYTDYWQGSITVKRSHADWLALITQVDIEIVIDADAQIVGYSGGAENEVQEAASSSVNITRLLTDSLFQQARWYVPEDSLIYQHLLSQGIESQYSAEQWYGRVIQGQQFARSLLPMLAKSHNGRIQFHSDKVEFLGGAGLLISYHQLLQMLLSDTRQSILDLPPTPVHIAPLDWG
ncbi:hypothetical protein MASR2M15_09610 [Anaerolineales bacterium]